MAFAVEDFEDLIRLLEERPDLRRRLRDALLSEKVSADLVQLDRPLQISN